MTDERVAAPADRCTAAKAKAHTVEGWNPRKTVAFESPG